MRAGRALRHLERVFLGLLGDLRGDELLLGHAVDDIVAARNRVITAAERVIVVGSLGQGGEVGRFRHRQLVHRLVEIQ